MIYTVEWFTPYLFVLHELWLAGWQEINSVLAAGLTVLAARTLEFLSSFCLYFPQD